MFAPATSITLNPDPALFFPQTMMGTRDLKIFPLYGGFKFAGALGGPLFADNGVLALIGAIGSDGGTSISGIYTALGQGIYGTAIPVAAGAVSITATSASITAGTVSIAYTVATGSPVSGYVYLISGTTDAPGLLPDYITSTSSSTPLAAITGPGGSTGTNYAHSGVITITCVGSISNSGSPGAVTAGGSTTMTSSITATGQFVTGDIIQVDVNTGSTVSSECKKFSVASGVLTITDASPNATWAFSHASACFLIRCNKAADVTAGTQGPFYHNIVQTSSMNSYTVEKAVAGVQSEQYTGCRFNKYALKVATGNTAAEYTADIMAQNVNVLATPSTVSVTNSTPFTMAEATLTMFTGSTYSPLTTSRIDIDTANFSLDNAVKDVWTFNQFHNPQFLVPTGRNINGTATAVFQGIDPGNSSLNSSGINAAYAYFEQIPVVGSSTGTGSYGGATSFAQSGNLVLTLAHPTSGITSPTVGSVQITFSNVRVSRYADDLKVQDMARVQLSWEGYYSLVNKTTVSALIGNSAWTPY